MLSVSEGTQGLLCDAPRLLPATANRGKCVPPGDFQEEVMQARNAGRTVGNKNVGVDPGTQKPAERSLKQTVPGRKPLIPESLIQGGQCVHWSLRVLCASWLSLQILVGRLCVRDTGISHPVPASAVSCCESARLCAPAGVPVAVTLQLCGSFPRWGLRICVSARG